MENSSKIEANKKFRNIRNQTLKPIKMKSEKIITK